MADNERLLGEIHATLKGIEKVLDTHLDDYGETKKRVEKVERRQIAMVAWFSGIFAAVGGSVTHFIGKIGL